jgi:hypothetical protein
MKEAMVLGVGSVWRESVYFLCAGGILGERWLGLRGSAAGVTSLEGPETGIRLEGEKGKRNGERAKTRMPVVSLDCGLGDRLPNEDQPNPLHCGRRGASFVTNNKKATRNNH